MASTSETGHTKNIALLYRQSENSLTVDGFVTINPR